MRYSNYLGERLLNELKQKLVSGVKKVNKWSGGDTYFVSGIAENC